jgi:hypothetical protein
MEDPYQQNGIERATGSDQLDHLMQQQLRAEQMEFFQRANRQPFEGFGGRQGLRDAVVGCLFILALGLIFKYVLHIG